jgi:hypothetical protein
MRARYFDPETVRFLNEDPNRIFGGINMYRYVFNNTANFNDPFGLAPNFSCTCRIAAGALAGGAAIVAQGDGYVLSPGVYLVPCEEGVEARW